MIFGGKYKIFYPTYIFYTAFAYLCEDMVKSITGRLVALTAVFLLICSTGCANLKDIRNVSFQSFKIKSLAINGFDSADAVLEVIVDNPAKDIDVSVLEGTAYKSGKPIGSFSFAPFAIGGRTTDTVTVSCTARLASGLSPLGLMSLASGKGISECTVDLTLRGRTGKSPQKRLHMKDIPLKHIVKDF